MKAMLLADYQRLEITDLPVPKISAEEILVRVAACGICGSDIHGYDGSTGRRIPPLVMGHEAAGTIEKVGSAVTNFRPGDRVTFDSTVSCGQCAYCQQGRVNLCDHREVLGVSCADYRRYGAFAQFVAVPARITYQLPEQLPFEHAALVEAVSVAVHAVARTPLTPASSVVVIGSGMIGLLVIQVLKHAGCQQIIAVDQVQERLTLAAQLGADLTLNSTQLEVPAAVSAATAGLGAEATLEVVGLNTTVKMAIDSTRKGGTVTLVGNLAPQVELPLQKIITQELTLQGSCASSGEYPECLQLMESGAVNVGPLISAQASLEDGPRWFERLYAGEPGLMKVVLQP